MSNSVYGKLVHFQRLLLCQNGFCLPIEKESTLKGNLKKSKLFPLKVDPSSEGTWCVKKLTGSHKVVSMVTYGRNYEVYQVPWKHS